MSQWPHSTSQNLTPDFWQKTMQNPTTQWQQNWALSLIICWFAGETGCHSQYEKHKTWLNLNWFDMKKHHECDWSTPWTCSSWLSEFSLATEVEKSHSSVEWNEDSWDESLQWFLSDCLVTVESPVINPSSGLIHPWQQKQWWLVWWDNWAHGWLCWP